MEAEMRARAAMQAMIDRLRPGLSAQVDEIEDAIAALREGTLTEAQREGAEQAAHQLAGSAGMLGVPQATDIALHLEAFFASRASAESTSLLSAVAWLETLRAELDTPPD